MNKVQQEHALYERMGQEAVQYHLGIHWKFALSNYKTICGQCNYDKKLITVSSNYLDQLGNEGFYETLFHEIAHAIAGHKAAHGPEWKVVAKRLGCKIPASINKNVTRIVGHLNAICDTCGAIVIAGRFRRSNISDSYHISCGEESQLNWVKND